MPIVWGTTDQRKRGHGVEETLSRTASFLFERVSYFLNRFCESAKRDHEEAQQRAAA